MPQFYLFDATGRRFDIDGTGSIYGSAKRIHHHCAALANGDGLHLFDAAPGATGFHLVPTQGVEPWPRLAVGL